MVFPQDIIIDDMSRKLYVLSDNLQKFQFGNYDPSETNFFITSADLETLTFLCGMNIGQSLEFRYF